MTGHDHGPHPSRLARNQVIVCSRLRMTVMGRGNGTASLAPHFAQSRAFGARWLNAGYAYSMACSLD